MTEGTSHPVRFVTAASLFDGHDASINIMRRILQASGAEVIHLGHNRSVGDIVNAEAVYVKTPLVNYADTGFAAYVSAQASRQGMVYAAANDGMLHAFNATTGAETWAYVPSIVLPTLYKLADKNYPALHQFYVDGTPVAGEIYDGSAWKTIVVGGLNNGGRGYYALDVTNPACGDMLRLSDARMSGTSYGGCLLHCAPEAAVGGPIAAVRDGDTIVIDPKARTLNAELSDAQIAERMKDWKAPDLRAKVRPGSVHDKYVRLVSSAHHGCVV